MALFPRKKKNDTRRQYRVRVHEEIQVRPKFGDHYPDAELMDVSARGAGLLIQPEDAELFEEGKPVDLTFTMMGRPRPVRARAEIKHVEEIDSQLGVRVKVGTEFLDVDDLYSQLDGKIWAFFNRRLAYRVELGEGQFPARLRYKAGTLEGWLHDLSVRGFAISIDRGTRLLMLPTHEGRAQFEIPGTGKEAPFEAVLVHRMAEQKTIRLGFRIDADRSPLFTRSEEQIREYVMERQRQELRGDE